MAQAEEHLPSKSEALSPNSNIAKKKAKRKSKHTTNQSEQFSLRPFL
jgi:hypothetical protein